MKKALLALSVLIACTTALKAQTTVNWFNDGTTAFRDGAGALLSQGNANANSDAGAMLVQLGYFSGQTGTGFGGTWIPLTGFGATNLTKIGDADFNNGTTGGGNGNGIVAFTTTFTAGTSNVDVYTPGDPGYYVTQSQFSITNSVPANNQVLSIRFYDTATSSGHYNTVQSSTWTWLPPNTVGGGIVNIDLHNSTLIWESVSAFGLTGTEFKTVLPIPEPSSLALLGLGLAAIPRLRRRKA